MQSMVEKRRGMPVLTQDSHRDATTDATRVGVAATPSCRWLGMTRGTQPGLALQDLMSSAGAESTAATGCGASKSRPHHASRTSAPHRAPSRYRTDIGTGDWPRPGTDSDRVLLVLAISRDVRSASRRAEAAT